MDMNNLYWLIVLGNFKDLCAIITIVGIICSVLLTLAYFATLDEEDEKVIKVIAKFRNIAYITLTVSIVGHTFIPSTKELYLIYGLGNTVDYLKSNPAAKQLPDKCIKALNTWIDSKTDSINK